MINKIFIEKDVANLPSTLRILQSFPQTPKVEIDSYRDVFEKVKRPYLFKQKKMQLFIAQKKGDLVKLAPDAYGTPGDLHYYFIHSYNCVYECQYCYLQGHFNSPDLVFFVNHEEIGSEIQSLIDKTPSNLTPWFHAGEFSDSLAMGHISGEIPFYFELFRKNPRALLELRTKSNNLQALKGLSPLDNIITSFSLAPAEEILLIEDKTPGLKKRLEAIKKLHERGFPIGIHFDPIIYRNDLFEKYEELLTELNAAIPLKEIKYLSMGVVRFNKKILHQIKQNYPESSLLSQVFQHKNGEKIRYNRPTRMHILRGVEGLALKHGMTKEQLYLCME
jgi:spore photoproduct lyase